MCLLSVATRGLVPTFGDQPSSFGSVCVRVRPNREEERGSGSLRNAIGRKRVQVIVDRSTQKNLPVDRDL